ncbi:DUF2909 domain-containing protein [Alteromonas sp. a30]|uniref:DUF2909 domain-containing protein n=1 Tax=Alteromonas sp. a30 TaxID=2730917 RepID=UPI00227E0745|nr:DUF2909 domain-containing protein [Alteromonas sp. a30]MCY7295729.1 DUF2909 domain-containing protein [Alteromonas sp. a30]
MIIKIVLTVLLLLMFYNLFRAMMIMLKNDGQHEKMSKYIGRRVFTSAIILLLIVIAVATGLITPNPRPY